MRATLASRKADDVALLQRVLAFGRAQRRLADKHDHPLLVQVVRVIRPELAPGLDLGQGRADQLTADPLTDQRRLDPPAFAVSAPVPLVTVEVERLHWYRAPATLRTRLRLVGVIERDAHDRRGNALLVPVELPDLDRGSELGVADVHPREREVLA